MLSDKQKQKAEPFPYFRVWAPKMDTIFTYNRLASRIQRISKNRKANIAYLKKLYREMSTSQKVKVVAPSKILVNKKDIQESSFLEKINPSSKLKDYTNNVYFLNNKKTVFKATTINRSKSKPTPVRTIKKMNAINTSGVNFDTKSTISLNKENQENIIYYLNGNLITKSALNKIPVNSVKIINIKRNIKESSIYITSK